jgi:hypothetical protein
MGLPTGLFSHTVNLVFGMAELKLGQRRGFDHTFDDRLGQQVKSDKLESEVLALVAAGHRRKNNLNR